ncbi:hypothetical protein KSD_46060 [Ktedonobacter sp. SOSP1-85]|nr:hypothetical protein KSD_46060 [Ktedonobacter sp. SOSP1-85]
MPALRMDAHHFRVEDVGEHFTASLTTTTLTNGVHLIHLHLLSNSQTANYLPQVKLRWELPIHDIYTHWHPASDRNKTLLPDWIRGYKAKVTSQMPVSSLLNAQNENRLTFAFSDALETVEVRVGVNEETGMLHCALHLFQESSPFLASYEATLRFDTRAIPYYEALADVQHWWATQPDYTPQPVPEQARLPMYSTWYSIHQALTPENVEEQCRISKTLGCESVIVDDGWQTTDNARGYAYCGDWQVALEKMPDMRAHVDRVHKLGMKYILWYSVPFIGMYSQAWERFKDRLLYTMPGLMSTGVVDPRYPEVREYLIQLYEQAVREWDLDGFKLDFVDSFRPSDNEPASLQPGQDELSVNKAVDRLLTDITTRLRALKPDILIEFRQSYVGPLMRKYGNMFRAGDCPYEFVTNRVRTLDIRLLCGSTAAHSDMLMWHKDETPEMVALQFINILFSVPQISILLDQLPESHRNIVRFWLSFWREHRGVLLDGRLMPLNPESSYPVVLASTPTKQVIAAYLDTVLKPIGEVPAHLLIVNGTLEQRLILELSTDTGERAVKTFDCQGHLVRSETLHLTAGIHRLAIPPAGVISLHLRDQSGLS